MNRGDTSRSCFVAPGIICVGWRSALLRKGLLAVGLTPDRKGDNEAYGEPDQGCEAEHLCDDETLPITPLSATMRPQSYRGRAKGLLEAHRLALAHL